MADCRAAACDRAFAGHASFSAGRHDLDGRRMAWDSGARARLGALETGPYPLLNGECASDSNGLHTAAVMRMADQRLRVGRKVAERQFGKPLSRCIDCLLQSGFTV
jgi:hypothetical protein